MGTVKKVGYTRFLGNSACMARNQLDYFKNRLILMKMALIERENYDQRDTRQQKNEVDAALKRIENGSYGYCSITGRQIGLQRLEEMPHAAFADDNSA